MVEIKVLSENTTYKRNFISLHGLSLLINLKQSKFLFDFGQKGKIFHNAKLLNEDLKNVDFGVLSHGHYDHSGGLVRLLRESRDLKIYAHPEIFTERYSSGRYIGIDENLRKYKKNFVFKKDVFEISNNIIFLGEIERFSREDESVKGFLKEDGNKDSVIDDTSIFLKTEKGNMLFCGCCHSGLFNTLLYIKKKLGVSSYYAIFGGLHLKNSSDKKLKLAKEILTSIEFKKIYPMHCTGFKGKRFLIENFKDKVVTLSCGDVILI